MRNSKFIAVLISMVMILTMLSACGSGTDAVQDDDNHLTVYLWETTLFDGFQEYVKEQCPDLDIEFIAGNNNVFLYDYLEKHGELPDIITTRRFSAADAKNLSPYLMDLSSYDVVSSFYPYSLQYYKNADDEIQWLPVCGIPETMLVNKTLFDQNGIEIPENYDELVEVCKELKSKGIKPFAYELSADWAAHTLIQSAALDKFTSLEGISWRTDVESADGEVQFDEELWSAIFHEVNTFINDTCLEKSDLQVDSVRVKEMFANREAAMFRGTPSVVEELRPMTDDELVRIPYFSQTSDESWVYTYPSLNISMNRSLEENDEKLEAAMKVLDCFLSQKGQELIACGQGMISYNDGVESDVTGMEGISDEIKTNSMYIRYASNNSFSASLEAVTGLLSGEMNEKKAFEAFRDGIEAEPAKEEDAVKFEKSYKLSVNENNGRDAASAILTTVRKANGADFAFTDYYSFSAPIYEGGCTPTELRMICNNDRGVPLDMAELTGSEVRMLIDAYLQDTGLAFRVTNKYELPVASGMKIILSETEDGYKLKDIEVEGDSIKNDAEYKIMLSESIRTVFDRVLSDKKNLESLDIKLTDAWQTAITENKQPAEPEDYISIEK